MFKQKNKQLFDRVLNAAAGERSPDDGVISQAALGGETRLSSVQQAALEQSLREAAGVADASVPARFNADVLACLQNTEVSQSAGRLIVTRLRWMALPAIIGFVAMSGISFAWGRLLCTPFAPTIYAERDVTAPPLPPLPLAAPPPPATIRAQRPDRQKPSVPVASTVLHPSSAQASGRPDANVKGADHVH